MSRSPVADAGALCLQLVVVSLLLLPGASLAAAADRPRIGIQELSRLDRLPALRRAVKVAAVTSYDRTGGNDDGFSGTYSYVRKEGDALVLADLQGPGCIYRIHTPTPTDDLLEFYFDGEPTPRVRLTFRELFSGDKPPFVKPLVGGGGGGYYCYVPLPFQKSCKIVLQAKHLQFYDLNYAIYPESESVATFDPHLTSEETDSLAAAQALFGTNPGDSLAKYNAPAGSNTHSQSFEANLAAGQTATLFETNQPGRIVGFRLGPAESLVGKNRDLLLRITWDGDDQPAVFCPAGDFFGYAWGKPAAKSCLLGTRDDMNYCYLPMPFDHSAKIELVSLRDDGPPLQVRGEVLVNDACRRPDEGKFYAAWRRENPTTRGEPFTFIDTRGHGHLVGLTLQAQGLETGQTLFFEGDDQTTIDGQLTVHGTGSEDFFNGGWYGVPDRWDGPLARPFSGCFGYQSQLARTGGYRFLITDAYRFEKSIRQTIEHAPTNNDQQTDYCGVTYLYCEPRPTVEFAVPDATARRVVDLKNILFDAGWGLPIKAFCFKDATLGKRSLSINGKHVRFLSLRAKGPDEFGPPFVSITCDLPTAGEYEVSIEAVRGPEVGSVQLFQDESPVGESVDLYAEEQALSGRVSMGVVSASEGANHLMFKIVGKNPAAETLGFDLINIQCEKLD